MDEAVSMSPLTIVVAWAEDRVIGRDGGLPWHHPEDLRHFKAVTMGHAIVMGRKCHESIGRALPGRRNIVISRNPSFEAPGCEVFDDFGRALDAAYASDPEPCVIGGAQVYALALPLATRIELTEIRESHPGDVVFPDLDAAAWTETARRESGPLVFRTLSRSRV